MSINELYAIQVNEGELSTVVETEEGNKLLEIYKKIEGALGFTFVDELCSLTATQLDQLSEKAYKQGFKDAMALVLESK